MAESLFEIDDNIVRMASMLILGGVGIAIVVLFAGLVESVV